MFGIAEVRKVSGLVCCNSREELLSKVCVCLLNKEKCGAVYGDVYHTDSKKFEGLVEAYYLRDGDYCAWIGRGLVEKLDVEMTELRAAAEKNNFESKIICIEDMIDGLLLYPAMGARGLKKSKTNMYVVTNEKNFRGAICAEEVKEFADFLNDDLYLLPSAIHEMIIVPCALAEAEALFKMVKEVNAGAAVAEDEYLIDALYKYSRITEKYERVM